MSKISDIIITYEPSSLEVNRICGHTFEAFDLYLFLKDYLPEKNIKIVIQDRTKKILIEKAFKYKYILDFKKIEKDIIINRNANNKKIIGKIIINTSGLPKNYLLKYKYKYFISFRCNPFRELFYKENFYYFFDKRVYKKFDKNLDYSKLFKIINSKKKFYFKYYKKISNQIQNTYLIYLNSNLRKISIDYYQNKFKEKKLIFISGDKFLDKNVLESPVDNLFEKFDTYLYTPIKRQFDCSPRLLTESYYYKKNIIFDFDFDSYAGPDYGDTGLYWRWHDIQNDFNSLIYDKNDELLIFLKNLLQKIKKE